MRQRINLFAALAGLFLFTIASNSLKAQPGDTITVQAFTFGSPQDAWFVFPSDTVSFEKIIMSYTLKCNSAQNPACGEWDYLTYTYLYDHTGQMDSNLLSHPNYICGGLTPDTLLYMLQPSWNYNPRQQYSGNVTDTSTITLNNTGSTASAPFTSDAPDARSLYLLKATDLLAQGLHAGAITSLSLNIAQSGSVIQSFIIRMKNSTATALNPEYNSMAGSSEVYHSNLGISSTGWLRIPFTTAFNWDGVSNIILELSYPNAVYSPGATVLSGSTSYPSSMQSGENDNYLYCSGNDYIEVPPAVYSGIDSAMTIAFWQYGDAAQPLDACVFEGIDASNQRVMNVHLPWSNGRVYWDCGGAGIYDRIDKACDSAAMYKGKWNHWAFVKNLADSSMSIYFNGQLWYRQSGKIQAIQMPARFKIAAGADASWGFYKGGLDDFSVWDAALDTGDLHGIMFNGISPSHPQYSHLRADYRMDENTGSMVSDLSPAMHDAAMIGMPERRDYQGSGRFKNFTASQELPSLRLGQGNWSTASLDSVWVVDSVMKPQLQIIMYADSLQPLSATDTLMVWPVYYSHYSWDAEGHATDSSHVTPDDTLTKKIWYYYSEAYEVINRFELARYITPYGNGLSLGNGWTWTFDVSDYRTLLHDSVHLAAGNWQELLDMKFYMIKGTPPRDVLGIRNLWNGGFNYGQNPDIETYLKPLKVYIPPATSSVRWKSRITGHGMDSPENCAEFCAKSHYFEVNGVQRYAKLVWRDNCDLNPLYPQGGTWVYDRANWCPGAEVWTYDMELTPYVNVGDTNLLDHDADAYTNTTGWDYYQIEDQLVFYGPCHFTLDAAIDKVLSPTNDQMWKRLNPICSHPSIVIKNNGSSNLTSLDITYGIHNAPSTTYHWTGNLEFGASTTVILDTFAWAQASSSFDFTISNPNGGVDEYAYNNSVSTPFTYVPVLPERQVYEIKTNANGFETAYTVKDAQGNILLERNNLNAFSTYSDTLNLPQGCYEFRLTDSGEDGLHFWANPDAGTGSAKIRSAEITNQVYKNFGTDFGGEIFYPFTVGLSSSMEEHPAPAHTEIEVWPNPADDFINIRITYEGLLSGEISISNILGMQVWNADAVNAISGDLRISTIDWPSGIYILNFHSTDENLSKKIILR
jgi:hypothetical protein